MPPRSKRTPAPQPLIAEDHDDYPHVLFKLPDNNFRVIYSRPASGFTAWRLQSRRDPDPSLASTWRHCVSVRGREVFLQALAKWEVTDPALEAFVRDSLPERVLDTTDGLL